MFGAARGVALGLGAKSRVNLNDLRNLQQQKHHHQIRSAANAASSAPCEVRTGETDDRGRSRRIRTMENINNAHCDGSKSTRKSSKKICRSEKRAKIVVKKSLDTSTFYAVCRAALFGLLLMGLGAAMATLGYYKDHFAGEPSDDVRAGNSTKKINASVRVQFESLSYVGPCVMGAGAFVLMIACVMTMEGRERNFATTTSCREPLLATTIADGKKASILKSTFVVAEPSSQRKPHAFDDNNNRDLMFASPGDDDAEGGRINKCYNAKDELKSNSTTTTTLTTWSKPVGPKCEPENRRQLRKSDLKYPSLPCIDTLVTSRSHDIRALLQRFLEDESRLVDDRLCKLGFGEQQRRQEISTLDGSHYYLPNQSVSLDAPDASSNNSKKCLKRGGFKSEEIPAKCKVVADVHRSNTSPVKKYFSHSGFAATAAFVAQDETYSPMSQDGSSCRLSTECEDDNMQIREQQRLAHSTIFPRSFSATVPGTNSHDNTTYNNSLVTIDLHIFDNHLLSGNNTIFQKIKNDINDNGDDAPIYFSSSNVFR